MTATAAHQDTLWDNEHAEEVQQLREELKSLNDELTRLTDRYMRLLKERTAWERTARTAARREAWRQVTYKHELYVFSEVSKPFALLCGRIAALPERPNTDEIERLKRAGQDVSRRLTEAAEDPETISQLAEVARLREAVQAQAVKLHEQFGDLSQGACVCPGCELVRSIDDVTGEAS